MKQSLWRYYGRVGLFCILASGLSAQIAEQPDAQRTRNDLNQILQRYPPTVQEVLALDPTLATNQAYLSTYPGLGTFISTHPEVVHNPAYFFPPARRSNFVVQQPADQWLWQRMISDLSAFLAFGMGIGLLTWVVRAILDHRRWNRLTSIQTDVHTKLMERFTGNEELLAYMKTPAGSKFLESSPIAIEAGPRSVGAPLSRILWSAQAGVVFVAGGIGLNAVNPMFSRMNSDGLRALGILCVALGIGFVLSGAVSYLISRRLGLIGRSENHVS